ncbi:hypothetical protein RIF29_15732 [Crotalaria pallida]|uniref:Uncharacterized protein n=1 Tax=Crotalaria pallida TaxID=3830 RepID=A0AAN9FHN7_CROPI
MEQAWWALSPSSSSRNLKAGLEKSEDGSAPPIIEGGMTGETATIGPERLIPLTIHSAGIDPVLGYEVAGGDLRTWTVATAIPPLVVAGGVETENRVEFTWPLPLRFHGGGDGQPRFAAEAWWALSPSSSSRNLKAGLEKSEDGSAPPIIEGGMTGETTTIGPERLIPLTIHSAGIDPVLGYEVTGGDLRTWAVATAIPPLVVAGGVETENRAWWALSPSSSSRNLKAGLEKSEDGSAPPIIEGGMTGETATIGPERLIPLTIHSAGIDPVLGYEVTGGDLRTWAVATAIPPLVVAGGVETENRVEFTWPLPLRFHGGGDGQPRSLSFLFF